jgi:hypothetical protein
MGLRDHRTRVYLDESNKDEWVEVRPLRIGELKEFRRTSAQMQAEGGMGEEEIQGYELSRLVLEACVVAWSDDDEPTPETIAELPYKMTFKLTKAAGLGSDESEETPLPDGSPSSAT